MLNRTWFRQGYTTTDEAYDGQPESICWYHGLPCGGVISVVSRMTGYGWRDIETGYCSACGKFWLASGGYDIRRHLDELESDEDMARWVMVRANNCVGIPPFRGYPHRSAESLCREPNPLAGHGPATIPARQPSPVRRRGEG